MNKVLTAFFAGVAAGLLFAPRSGKTTRKKIAGIFSNANDTFKSILQDEKEHIPDVYERIELSNKSITEPSFYSEQ